MPNHLHQILKSLVKNEELTDVPGGYQNLINDFRYYRDVIGQYISYYNELPDPGKLRFLKRVHYFKCKKVFHYIDI